MSIDIDTLVRRSARLEVEDLDLGAFAARPLDPDTLRCLRYMHDVESHTVCYLRDMLVTRAHRDPSVTAFLTCWSYEEHWHGEAIGRVLECPRRGGRSQPPGRDAPPAAQARRPAARWCSTSPRPSPAISSPSTWPGGRSTNGPRRRATPAWRPRPDNPVLGELLRRIMRQEGRHIDFYASQARSPPGRQPWPPRSSPGPPCAACGRPWDPASCPRTRSGSSSVISSPTPPGLAAAQRIDRHIDRLPGLEGLHLIENSVAELAA